MPPHVNPVVPAAQAFDTQADIKDEVQRLSAQAVAAMSRRDWNFTQTPKAWEILEHVAPNWTARFDNHPGYLTFVDQTTAHRLLIEESPTLYYQIESMYSIVAESKEAGVFLQIDIKNVNNMTICGFSEFRWRWSGSCWAWYYHLAMRGPNVF